MNDAPSVIATAAQAGTQESWPRARLVRPDLAIHLFEREQVSAFFAVARLGSPMLVGVAVAPPECGRSHVSLAAAVDSELRPKGKLSESRVFPANEDIDGRGSGTDQRRDPAASLSPPAPFGVPASVGGLKKADRVITVPKRGS